MRGSGQMKIRKYVITAAILAAGLGTWAGVTAASSSDTVSAITATDVTSTINVMGNPGETFAPPPSDASSALTLQEAVDAYAGHEGTEIPQGITAQLGLYTMPVGPYCGEECDGLIEHNGTVYTVYQELAYGFLETNACPDGYSVPDVHCDRWTFLDANTGAFIGEDSFKTDGQNPDAASPEPSDSASPSDSAAPSDSASP